ncbi:MAG: FAD-dependent oxidoreductase [Desulfofustis sp.]|nr:FAD-dependent oxidoreductase [Desulfofustis sp.]
MNNVILNPLLAQPRIINFSALKIDSGQIIPAAFEDAETAVASIRTYSDHPFIFIVSSACKSLVAGILDSLAAIRSTCYPHALFVVDGDFSEFAGPNLEVVPVSAEQQKYIISRINDYANKRFSFDTNRLGGVNPSVLPDQTDIVIVGGGITGLYAASRIAEQSLDFCLVEARDIAGGIWTQYANATSQVNTSEGAYRLIEPDLRTNRDHSTTAEILTDMERIFTNVREHLYTGTRAERIDGEAGAYRILLSRSGTKHTISCKGIILAVNDRIGPPREITWDNQQRFNGIVCQGMADKAREVSWRGKRVAVIGMGAFAVENVRTALENGADRVIVVCRRHGTVCPKIIDYLNFATPYDEHFLHDRKSNIRNMMLWKKLYDLSGATQPECWMGKIKHEGHTISVSDIWFIAHFLKKLNTVTGSVTGLYESGVIVDHHTKIDADVVVNCIGFHRNSPEVARMCGRDTMYNNNYIDKDFMYLADAYIDDDVFNSFFGSSVLEMTKFYMDVYLDYFDNPGFDQMMKTDGIASIAINDRRWSHYIAGAEALIRHHPRFRELARRQIDARTANFLQSHDLDTYIAANRREWRDLHQLLSGRKMAESECLPYVFDKLVERKIG